MGVLIGDDEPCEDGPQLSLVIPAFNESARLPETLRILADYLREHAPNHEVLVSDDGSSDGTAEIVRERSRDWSRLRLIRNGHAGRGAALRAGCLAATGNIVGTIDADLATPVTELTAMLQHFTNGEDLLVAGCRTYQHEDSKWRRILGLSLQILTHLLVYDCAVVDSQCALKVMTRRVARELFGRSLVDGDLVDVEIISIAHGLKVPLLFQPVHWVNKAGSRTNVVQRILSDLADLVRIRINRDLGRYRTRSPTEKGTDTSAR